MALGMGITDGKLLYCHVVAEENVDRKISTLEYNNRTFNDWLNKPFIDEFSSPPLNLPPITFDDRPRPHKRSRYTPDLLPYAISVASENYFSTLITSSVSTDLLPSDAPNNLHFIKKYEPFLDRTKIGYFFRKHDKTMLQNEKIVLLHIIW